MPVTDIHRLLAPRSIALVGASAWIEAVAAGNTALGYQGELWRVHPTRPSTATTQYFRSIGELPGSPDATFIAVPNQEAGNIAAALVARDAGGFVCFSSGFAETGSEHGHALTADLISKAGDLPFFGPNCYGFVNFFDRAALLPDQVVGGHLERGVAIICQSGTLALTLMFADRSLPIGYLITVGNQTRLAVEDLIELLCDDPRVTAFGLYVEGIKDTARFARAADQARAAGKPIAIIKSGRTAAAARTAHSHTGALAGADSVFEAFCRQAGLARCDTLGTLCETLKIFHLGGALPGRKILIMGASGGDMAMTADVARSLNIDFAPIPHDNAVVLQQLLTDRVTIANPFDIHTYLWFDPPALGRVFAQSMQAGYDAVGFVLDFPPEDKADTRSFDGAIGPFLDAARNAARTASTRAVLISSLPETLSARVRARCFDAGVVPLQGQREALEAIALAGAVGETWASGARVSLQIPTRSKPAPDSPASPARSLTESEGKAVLAEYGMPVPQGRLVAPPQAAAAAAVVGFPVVMKAVGAHLEHKTEVGGVILNIGNTAAATAAALRLATLSDILLIEQMTVDAVAEILVGVILDPQFGQVLVIGAGGVLTELLADSVTLLPPWTPTLIRQGIERLNFHPLLRGYRGRPPGDVQGLIDAIHAIAGYATANVDAVLEIDVNPVLVRPQGSGAIAVDALIRLNQLA